MGERHQVYLKLLFSLLLAPAAGCGPPRPVPQPKPLHSTAMQGQLNQFLVLPSSR